MPDGCPEQFSLEFYRFIWRTRHSSRRAIQRLIDNAPAEKHIYILQNLREVEVFLNALPKRSAPTQSD